MEFAKEYATAYQYVLQGSSVSKWDDVVFIPPGLNVSVGVRETALG